METVLRAAIIYAFLFFVMRIVGKKELSGMSAFELVLLVIMGDLIQQGVTQQDTSVTASMLAIGEPVVIAVGADHFHVIEKKCFARVWIPVRSFSP